MSDRQSIWTWERAILKSSLKPTTRHVLLTLGCYLNKLGEGAYPSTNKIARDTGLSQRAVITHLQFARQHGFIAVKNHGFRGQKWGRNEYFAILPSKKGTEPNDISANNQSKGTEPNDILSEKALNLTTEGTEPNDVKALNEVQSNIPVNIPVSNIPPIVPQIDFENLFNQFWLVYPNRQGKQGAKSKFERLVKSGVDGRAIILGAQRYAAWCKASCQPSKFIKHPSTWLNKGCWDDELDAGAEYHQSSPRREKTYLEKLNERVNGAPQGDMRVINDE